MSYHDTVNDLQDRAWSGKGPFTKAGWFALLEQAGHRPMLAVAEDALGAVCLLLEHGDKGLQSLTNWYAFSWPVLTFGEPDRARLLSALARDLAGQARRVALAKLHTADADLLVEAFRAAGWRVEAEAVDTNHHVLVPPAETGAFAAYLAARPGRLRTTLKRKAKKVEVALATRFCADDWSDYEAIYAESWKPAEGDPALLRRFAEAESAAGHYRFALARHDGRAVAAQFWSVEDGTAYIHKLAHRPDADHLSPGTTLTAALMEHVIDVDRVGEVDFGTGDDAYKRDWMDAARPLHSLIALRPADPRNWAALGKAAIRDLVRR
ncbi:hypothetical protein AAW00_02950 [Aurantiacibacter luteus]|uniref:N-acetyltransferase domain-containing protein n=1 Tax=Aurantiacibacter luteus TaxID=1581420 RepID=A0A0G9MZ62_9SPHN|nr:hypothetical protein AAW00_02950 [Aurantiacibacter luteus]